MAKDTAMMQMKNPGLIFTISFFVVMIVSALVIALSNMLLPKQIVLGTISITHFRAILLSSGALSLFTVLCMPLFTQLEIRNKRALTPPEMMLGYFFVNVIGLWLVTRLADLFGLGVTSWFIVVGMAIVLDIVQGVAMMGVEQWRLQNLR